MLVQHDDEGVFKPLQEKWNEGTRRGSMRMVKGGRKSTYLVR